MLVMLLVMLPVLIDVGFTVVVDVGFTVVVGLIPSSRTPDLPVVGLKEEVSMTNGLKVGSIKDLTISALAVSTAFVSSKPVLMVSTCVSAESLFTLATSDLTSIVCEKVSNAPFASKSPREVAVFTSFVIEAS